jgi:uncharacterized protein YjiS (DUF1127 family)
MKAISFGAATGRTTQVIREKVQPGAGRRWLKASLSRISVMLHEWHRRRRDRAELATLDERMLRDIGVSRAEVLHEINKPFWRK